MAVRSSRLLCVLNHICLSSANKTQQFSPFRLTERIYTPAVFQKCSVTDTSAITSGRKLVNGVDFHNEETGQGKHTLLLLPGALGSTRTDFLPQLTGLSTTQFRIIALDPRGYGRTRPPDRDWPLNFYQRDADDAAAFMKALGIPQYSVLGWSDGGIMGMILAAAHPGHVQKLVIWGSNAYISKLDQELYKKVADINKWSDKMKQPFIDLYGEEYFLQLWEGWNKAIQKYVTQRNGDLCIGSLPNIKCPTLIVNGVQDPMLSQEHPTFLSKHITNSRLVNFPEGKHNLHLRYYDKFNILAEAFLKEGL